MVDPEGNLASLPVFVPDLLEEDDVTAVMYGMRRSESPFDSPNDTDAYTELRLNTTFTQQMHRIFHRINPDVILATYRSATPVLNAIESYYETCQEQLPALDYVDVSRDHRSPSFQPHDHDARETARLAQIVRDRSVVIVEQHVASGNSVRRARNIVKDAGASMVHGMLGTWYKGLTEQQGVFRPAEAIRGTHVDFMRSVGAAAARTPVYVPPRPFAYGRALNSRESRVFGY